MSQAPNFAMIGLGRMGANIVRRLAKAGITSVVYDVSQDAVEALGKEGAITSKEQEEKLKKILY